MQYTTEQIKNAFEKASPVIKQVLEDSWITEESALIGKESKLRIDKVDILIQLIGLTLLNLISISDFIPISEKELGIENELAVSVAKKVDEKVFQRVRQIVNHNVDIERENKLEDKINEENLGSLIDDIENHAEDSVSFKDKLNKVTVKEVEKRVVDPYAEPID